MTPGCVICVAMATHRYHTQVYTHRAGGMLSLGDQGHLLGLAGARTNESIGRVVVPLETAVQVLGAEVLRPKLLPRSTPAALGVHAVPAALLVTCRGQW